MKIKIKSYNHKKYYEKIVILEVYRASLYYNNGFELTIRSANPREELLLIIDEFKWAITDSIINVNECTVKFNLDTEVKLCRK